MTRTVASIIGGVPQREAPGGRLTVPNPADLSDTVAEALLGDAGTFVDACRAARAAQPGWASVPAPVRGRAIQQLGRLVEENLEALARLITREIGKPIAESRGEVQEVIDTCNFFLGEGRRLYGQTVPSEMPDKQLFTFRAPVGVAAIVTAGNFPVAVPSWYLVPALLCGNAVVWKPAEYTPATAEAFAQLFLHAGLPTGAFNLVLADGAADVRGTRARAGRGPRRQGRASPDPPTSVGGSASSAAGTCSRRASSSGGKNPLVVMPDADLDLAVEGALFSGFGTAGQRCTSLGTAIVHDDDPRRVRRRGSTRPRSRRPIGDPTEDVLYGPMISERFARPVRGRGSS